MSPAKKRFGRSRAPQEDPAQFALTDEDRQLAELAARTLPRNRAAEAFERSAKRSAEDPARDEDTAASAEQPDTDEAKVTQRRRAREERNRRRAARRAAAQQESSNEPQPTPLWYKVVMIGLLVVGLLWIIAYYLFQGMLPIPGIELWNLVIGLGFMMVGLIMTTRWR